MSESPGIAELYALGHASFDEFARTLSDDDWLHAASVHAGVDSA